MKKGMMTAKAMEEMYVTYGLDEKTWDMLYNMTCHGLITRTNWDKFYDKCHGYTFGNDEHTTIVNHHLVTVYRMDDHGFFKSTTQI